MSDHISQLDSTETPGDTELLLGEEEDSKTDKMERVGYQGSYYNQVANSKYIRPICIMEDVHLPSMSKISKFKWYFQTIIQMISLIIFSVRSDRLFQPQYLRHHWKHYFCMLFITGLSWAPQLLDTFGPKFLGYSPIPRIPLSSAIPICIFGLFYYILGITAFFECIAPALRRNYGIETTLKVWELFISVAWQTQTIGFWVLTITPPLFSEDFKGIDEKWTTGLGLLMVVAGVGFKMSAIYGTGYNTYYWYDMITEIPNAYFSEVGIYKYCGSPTYTLGRFTGFGAALHYRSVPIALASIVDLVLINLFNRWVEQPFVQKMYLEKSIA
ncbi:uncharacterized protein LOC111696190 [Eurytemora carolleeae]|uniref:uncharacterized protein LOC111696190 n=1 Tax=Eurytemora carolleeae TaxID=1294199 RepID=UPI000C761E1A|nr:uncharacterized protein LOC111696190 [Eurytemora carolleeae]|eukprot:XP_023321507.1 uncharacterized protein LOC111696190 [Eurytemora affinis]